MGTSNHLKFSDNIFEPDYVEVEKSTYRILKARFANLYALYEYLKSEPEINEDIFRSLSSLTGSKGFAGKPYEDAVEDLIGEIDPGYKEFLRLQSTLNAKKGTIHKYRTVRTIVGGHLNIPAYCAGNPLCYETEELIQKPKFVQVHACLSYHCGTTKVQVFNRAIIMTNIVKALEKAGYSVNLNTFELSSKQDELAYIVVELKRHGGHLDMQSLYKTMCRVEFLRRILFRILETLDVNNWWSDGYGSPCSEKFIRSALKLGKDDIFFDQPSEMGIEGEDLAYDFEAAIDHLNMQDKLDVQAAKREFRNQSKILTMKKRDD